MGGALARRLADLGITGEMLVRWKRSGLRDVPFRNFVMRVDSGLDRPFRMEKRVRAAMMDAATC